MFAPSQKVSDKSFLKFVFHSNNNLQLPQQVVSCQCPLGTFFNVRFMLLNSHLKTPNHLPITAKQILSDFTTFTNACQKFAVIRNINIINIY
jgi:hypothetical protein